jgi:hypothetical protein
MSNPTRPVGDVWCLPIINPMASERIGYPTQKPERLLERVLEASSDEGGVVADFFCGGGTTAAVAQRLGRRWIACDQSRVAVAITADRLTRQVEEQTGKMFAVPDFTVEHWGVYEARRLSEAHLNSSEPSCSKPSARQWKSMIKVSTATRARFLSGR